MFPFDIRDLGGSFSRYFEIVPALTDELRQHAYRIRHQVYCEELKYEAIRANRLETDEYDARSLHCLIRSVQNGRYVGCTRVVLSHDKGRSHPLPFEKLCAHTIDRSLVDPRLLVRSTIAEVSRLAVISQYRLRRGEQNVPVPINDDSFGTQLKPRFPYIPVGLYLGTLELARLHGVETLFVLTEPRLAKHFAKLGVEIIRIGGEIEHRGTRVPSMMRVTSIIDGLNFIVRPLYNVIAKEVQDGVNAQRGRS